MFFQSDILIIGSGIAGLSLALKSADQFKVHLITKREAFEANTRYAQGGIAAVMESPDDFASHIRDTQTAGANLCDPKVVEKIISDGPRLIGDLIDWGVLFSRRADKELDLTLEGGHSQRRVVHAGDITGAELARALLEKARQHPNIVFFEHHSAIDLILSQKIASNAETNRCLGAYVYDREKDVIHTFSAKSTVLATGGAGKVYLYTSNPDVATGDGMAMAYRAGADMANLEFVQFHPTCLYNPGGWALAANKPVRQQKSFLISEAVRGEGALLKLSDGSLFMEKYHPLQELAPRDVVARAIDQEMKRRGDDYVLLDISHKDPAFIKERFPNIYQACHDFGFDLARGPIPVVPAAHYFCGGIVANLKAETTVDGLLAIGECAHTGLHGANRLASNSLLEGLAMADYASHNLAETIPHHTFPSYRIPEWDAGQATPPDEMVVMTQTWDEIRRFMWNYVGIVRTTKRLTRALTRIRMLEEEIRDFYWNSKITTDLLELRNLAQMASMIIECALKRKESRGLHYNLDYPTAVESERKDTVIRKT